MRDALCDFRWDTLYNRYDAKCKTYDSRSRCLDRCGSDRPETDRELYYRLIDCYSPSARVTDPDMVGTYQALLYWKLYSTAGSKGTNILNWLKQGGAGRRLAESQLPKLLSRLPPSIERSERDVVDLMQSLPKLPGMGSGTKCRLPVRSTFLHFLFPSVVPIFDIMVLRAVGVVGEEANQDICIFREYLGFAWQLADRYSVESRVCSREEPLRRIEMALWVTGGSK